MRTSSETLYASLLGVAVRRRLFVLLTTGDRMSDLHGFTVDLEELSPPFPARSKIVRKELLSQPKIDHKILYLIHP